MFLGRAIIAGWTVKYIQPISNPTRNLLQGRKDQVFTKLRIFELEEYDQVLYLDADAVVMKNIGKMALQVHAAISSPEETDNMFNVYKGEFAARPEPRQEPSWPGTPKTVIPV